MVTNPKSNNFRVCLTYRFNTVRIFKLCFELLIITYNSIMYKCNTMFKIKMRMRISICLVSMSGPSCMSDSNLVIMFFFTFQLHSLNTITTESVRACKLRQHKFAVLINRYNSTTIISSTLEYLQALYTNLSRILLITNVPNNSTALSDGGLPSVKPILRVELVEQVCS